MIQLTNAAKNILGRLHEYKSVRHENQGQLCYIVTDIIGNAFIVNKWIVIVLGDTLFDKFTSLFCP